MRAILAVAATIIASSQMIDTAEAYTRSRPHDPFRWCVHYRGQHGGAVNCGFYTFYQCQATASGNIGFCLQNPFYTGPRNDDEITAHFRNPMPPRR